MNAHSTMLETVQVYLAMRRQAGYTSKIAAQRLICFARFTDESGYRGPLTVEVASRWARASKHGRRLTAAQRLAVVRRFARYCLTHDPATEIPPPGLFGPEGSRRLTPHIYTDQEVRALLESATALRPAGGLRGVSCATMFGLIAATGLRTGEATTLKRSDVDLKQGLLHIRGAKGGKSREVPLHPTTTRVLLQYAQRRDRDAACARTEAFFVFDHGRAASITKVEDAFRLLRRTLNWRSRGGHAAPRICDLRHRFITYQLTRWHKEGIDVDQRMLALSTYVGHSHPSHTYWYVTATPELLAFAARRFQAPEKIGRSI
jgi:integrase